MERPSLSLPASDRLHGGLGIDEAETVELAVALADQVEEAALERHAALEGAEEAGSTQLDRAFRNQHSVTQQVGRIAAGGAVDRPCLVGFVAVHAERETVAAAERSRRECEVQLLPLAGECRRIGRY